MTQDKDDRRQQLTRAWTLMSKRVLAILESDEPPSASALEICRKWLDNQGVTADTVLLWGTSLGFDPKTLPKFDDTDEHDSASSGDEADPLRKVLPFKS